MRTLVVIIALCFAWGCSTALYPQETRIASGGRVTCRPETPTGTIMRRTICKTDAERAAEEAEGKETLTEQQRPTRIDETFERLPTRGL